MIKDVKLNEPNKLNKPFIINGKYLVRWVLMLVLFSSCTPEIQKRVIPHFFVERVVQTDVNRPADIYVSGGYIFILDGIDQTIKRFNNSEIQFGGFGTDKETFLKVVSIYGSKGNIFVLDKDAREIKIFDTDGNYISLFSINEVENPSDIVLDGFGKVYILDRRNFKIYIYTEDGEFEDEFGAYGWGAGFLHSPCAIAYDNQSLYILDDKRISIFDPQGNYLREIRLIQGGKDISVDRFIYVLINDGVDVFNQRGNKIGKITGKWDRIYAKANRIYLAKGSEIDIYRVSE